jgi:hypothetical protein
VFNGFAAYVARGVGEGLTRVAEIHEMGAETPRQFGAVGRGREDRVDGHGGPGLGDGAAPHLFVEVPDGRVGVVDAVGVVRTDEGDVGVPGVGFTKQRDAGRDGHGFTVRPGDDDGHRQRRTRGGVDEKVVALVGRIELAHDEAVRRLHEPQARPDGASGRRARIDEK